VLQRQHVELVELVLDLVEVAELKFDTPNAVKAGAWPGLLGFRSGFRRRRS